MISVKVRWEQWCRWNCDLRVINARKQAFSVCTESIAMTLKIMCTYVHITLRSHSKMASSHRVTDVQKIPVQISKDGAPAPVSAVGPLFISCLLFHLSQTLLGAWRFSLFRSVYCSFHNRLDLIRDLAFYWVFYFIFPIYPCLFHHIHM